MAKYIRPTRKTKYHIDFDWWEKNSRNLRRYLLEHACEECRNLAESDTEKTLVDWVDPETGEVFTIDRLWYDVYAMCVENHDYLDKNLPLTSLIFRLFISNNNKPLTSVEIHQGIGKKSAGVILKMLSGQTIYKGIRPVFYSTL